MSIATITHTVYNSPTSQATFLSMLDTAMIAAGFTLFDSKNISGVENKIYSLALSSATKGTVYLRASLTSAMLITARLSGSWNTSTNTATNEGTSNTSTSFSLTSLATITFTAINSAELKGVLIVQGTVSFLLGIIRPANVESWYDDNQWTFAFNADNSTNPNVYTTTLTPGNTASNWSTNYTTALTNPNPYNSNARQIKPIEYYHPSGYGSVCNTSSDLAWCASANIVNTGLDELVTSNATYLYIGKSGASSCSLVVRTA